MSTKVMKFGGSSVANGANIKKVIDIILDSKKENQNIIVVVSALGGVTDDLVKLAKGTSGKNGEYEILFKNICQRHKKVVEELVELKNQKNVLQKLNKKYSELEEILKSFIGDELSLQLLDTVMSFGEQLSAYVISEVIKSRGIDCGFIDARSVIKTNDDFGNAVVDIENSYELISSYVKKQNTLLVMGGFIGSTKDGITTTLGRGGSDYTASLVGAALDASVIEIWTDVDGVMTADPRKVKDAVLIPELSYQDAEKMALAGAKVIHPKTMKPAQLKGIPIYIKNTFNSKAIGTKIS